MVAVVAGGRHAARFRMARSLRRRSSVALIALALFGSAIACSSTEVPTANNAGTPVGSNVASAGASGSNPAGERPAAGHSMVTLLGLAPKDAEAQPGGIVLTDVEEARRRWSPDPPDPSAPIAELGTYQLKVLQQQMGLYSMFPGFPGCTSCDSTATVAEHDAGARDDFGFVFDDIDATVSFALVEMLLGRFDPAAAERSLRKHNPEVRASWHRDAAVFELDCSGASTAGTPAKQMCATGRPFAAIRSDVIIQAGSIEEVRETLDRVDGAADSAANDPVLQSAAAALDAEGVYAAQFLATSRGGCDVADATGTTQQCLNARLYAEGTRGAFGFARQDDRPAGTVVFALSNPDQNAAAPNGEAVKRWFEGNSIINSQPLSEDYEPSTVRVDGAVAIVAVPIKAGHGFEVFWSQYLKRDYPAW